MINETIDTRNMTDFEYIYQQVKKYSRNILRILSLVHF